MFWCNFQLISSEFLHRIFQWHFFPFKIRIFNLLGKRCKQALLEGAEEMPIVPAENKIKRNCKNDQQESNQRENWTLNKSRNNHCKRRKHE